VLPATHGSASLLLHASQRFRVGAIGAAVAQAFGLELGETCLALFFLLGALFVYASLIL